jgi:hypothetical protein
MVLALAALAAGCEKKAPLDRPAGLPPLPGASSGEPPSPPTTAPSRAEPPPVAPAAKDDVEVVGAPPPAGETISGTITLPAAHKKSVGPGDVVFIIARRAGGPPGPASMLAVQKHPASEFPLKFTLSNRDSMVPGMPFQGPVNLSVRLDKDGNPLTRKKGDLLGEASGVKVGTQDVAISLDTVLSEDQALKGGPGPMMGGPPAGTMPPGHP